MHPCTTYCRKIEPVVQSSRSPYCGPVWSWLARLLACSPTRLLRLLVCLCLARESRACALPIPLTGLGHFDACASRRSYIVRCRIDIVLGLQGSLVAIGAVVAVARPAILGLLEAFLSLAHRHIVSGSQAGRPTLSTDPGDEFHASVGVSGGESPSLPTAKLTITEQCYYVQVPASPWGAYTKIRLCSSLSTLHP